MGASGRASRTPALEGQEEALEACVKVLTGFPVQFYFCSMA